MVESEGTIDEETAIAARKWMDIDELVWTNSIAACCAPSSRWTTAARSVSKTLAAALGEESVTLEDICEPYLMQMGMLTRTPAAAA